MTATRTSGIIPLVTTTPSQAPIPEPGWYADPQGGHGLRWWDGTTWTAATRPVPGSSGSHRPSLGPGWGGLAVSLQVVLVVGVLVELTWVALDLWGWTLAEGWRQDASTVDPGAARRYDAVTLGGVVMLFVTYLAGGVLFITWLFRAHRSDRMQAEQLRHGSGWAIGGWFVPVLNLVRPIQMVLDLRRGAAGSPAGGLPVAWWLTYLVSGVVTTVATFLLPDASTSDAAYLEVWQQSMAVDGAGSALAAASGVLAVLVVRSSTRMVEASPRGRR